MCCVSTGYRQELSNKVCDSVQLALKVTVAQFYLWVCHPRINLKATAELILNQGKNILEGQGPILRADRLMWWSRESLHRRRGVGTRVISGVVQAGHLTATKMWWGDRSGLFGGTDFTAEALLCCSGRYSGHPYISGELPKCFWSQCCVGDHRLNCCGGGRSWVKLDRSQKLSERSMLKPCWCKNYL